MTLLERKGTFSAGHDAAGLLHEFTSKLHPDMGPAGAPANLRRTNGFGNATHITVSNGISHHEACVRTCIFTFTSVDSVAIPKS